MFSPDHSHFTTTDARRFDGVDTWVFDLDNTLYPSDARVWPQVDERITLYVMRLYGLDGLSARALQKHFYHRYGTTLKALMIEDGVEPHDFLDFAHDIDHSTIKLDPALGSAIERLPGRKLILTNGSRRHAENVAAKLGILDHFEDVFDIAAADFVPKPERSTYERFLDRHGVDPRRSALFEDIARNLLVPHDLGMATVLVVPPVLDPFRERFEQEAVKEPHIDYITNDLAGFLAEQVLPEKGAGQAA
ncbi:pyrimidine 5'-nucleotidase [Methylobacterium durans]|uniref:Pyrimidine 5'-nucleotidase n=1 Tax=Methylobacterium durans TaxID=2202825 RepID=A0A2U8W9W7_9HYPH|nr:pyrimidine 5'-nucleotidase [Methylobacterium durans]AWN42112.1 pyrimidine 5'-nucleotidase [Methylobacterium durans]MEA1831796.1 pyrimidine 5'-nucleotidase [Methylobacterium durans]